MTKCILPSVSTITVVIAPSTYLTYFASTYKLHYTCTGTMYTKHRHRPTQTHKQVTKHRHRPTQTHKHTNKFRSLMLIAFGILSTKCFNFKPLNVTTKCMNKLVLKINRPIYLINRINR